MAKAPKGRGCPICGQPQNPKFMPFCSQKCADTDLERWLGGKYRIETDEAPQKDAQPEKPNED